MFEKLAIRIQLRRTVKAKRIAVKNHNFETAAHLRDDEKKLLKKMGISAEQIKKYNNHPGIFVRWFKTIKLNYQKRKLISKLEKIKKQEINSINKLNYNEANRLQEEEIALQNQIDRIENKKTANNLN